MLKDVHTGLPPPAENLKFQGIASNYVYFHYGIDKVDDRGWGCGYRTLQTICSWICLREARSVESVPSLRQIQETLVEIEDKPKSFIGSRQWIGSVEVCYVLDKLYDVVCKIRHVPSGSRLDEVVPILAEHFRSFGSPVMMGGDIDAMSKCILGVASTESNHWLLVLDPHFYGTATTKEELQSKGWVKWVATTDFLESSFYNICLPQVK